MTTVATLPELASVASATKELPMALLSLALVCLTILLLAAGARARAARLRADTRPGERGTCRQCPDAATLNYSRLMPVNESALSHAIRP